MLLLRTFSSGSFKICILFQYLLHSEGYINFPHILIIYLSINTSKKEKKEAKLRFYFTESCEKVARSGALIFAFS